MSWHIARLQHVLCASYPPSAPATGNTLDHGGARVEARVIGANASQCAVEDRKDGTYILTFTAGAVGEYRVVARLDNTEMPPVNLHFAEGSRLHDPQKGAASTGMDPRDSAAADAADVVKQDTKEADDGNGGEDIESETVITAKNQATEEPVPTDAETGTPKKAVKKTAAARGVPPMKAAIRGSAPSSPKVSDRTGRGSALPSPKPSDRTARGSVASSPKPSDRSSPKLSDRSQRSKAKPPKQGSAR